MVNKKVGGKMLKYNFGAHSFISSLQAEGVVKEIIFIPQNNIEMILEVIPGWM